MTWAYDPNTRLYRDDESNDTLSRARQMDFMTRSIEASHAATTEMAMLNSVGDLSASQWRTQMREEIKREIIRHALLGQGGREQMTHEAWSSVGGVISDQYRHLDRKADNFFEQVEAGELSEAEIARRARMYINSSREAYERGLRRRLRGSDYDETSWNITTGESCADCLDLAALGWMPIGELSQFPGDGRTQCKTNCGCFTRYRRSDTEEMFEGG